MIPREMIISGHWSGSVSSEVLFDGEARMKWIPETLPGRIEEISFFWNLDLIIDWLCAIKLSVPTNSIT